LQSIEKELLQRLQSGTYGDIYNFPVKEYEKVLAMEEMEAEDEESEEEEVRFKMSFLHALWAMPYFCQEGFYLRDLKNRALIFGLVDVTSIGESAYWLMRQLLATDPFAILCH